MENNSATVRTKIRDHFSNLLLEKGEKAQFSDADSLVISGRLDSLDVVQTVLFLESEFGINFSAIGFDQNFVDSVDAIMKLIK